MPAHCSFSAGRGCGFRFVGRPSSSMTSSCACKISGRSRQNGVSSLTPAKNGCSGTCGGCFCAVSRILRSRFIVGGLRGLKVCDRFIRPKCQPRCHVDSAVRRFEHLWNLQTTPRTRHCHSPPHWLPHRQ